MHRNLELCRKVLLEMEKSGGRSPLNGRQLAQLTGADERAVNYQLKLLVEAGWVESVGKPHYAKRSSDAVPDRVLVSSLTNAGHDFLEVVGEPSRWQKFLVWAGEKLVSASLSTVLQLAMRFALGAS